MMFGNEFADARTAFLEAQAIDPGFVMAIWGEAMTLNHPLWADQDREEALNVLAKLPPETERKITPHEQAFLDAVEILYGFGEEHPGDKPSRDIAYMQAMQRAQEAAGNLKAAAETQALLASNWKGDLQAFRQSTYPWLGD